MGKPKNFDALTVCLNQSNLVEASAGTGKTYSIAILVLRLLLEKKLSVKEILMVTFTKAAVAELEERIRLFIRSAYKLSNGEKIKDLTITSLVNKAIEQSGKEEVHQLLKDAVLFLDETAVLTIHSFCQQTLTEFAFETNQLFGADTLQDNTAVIQEEVNKFWRSHITTIPPELLHYLIEQKLTRARIVQVIKEHINGKKYLQYDAAKDYSFCDADHEDNSMVIKNLEQEELELRACLYRYLVDNNEKIKAICESNNHARKNVLHLVDKPEELLQYIISKRSTGYIVNLFHDILDKQDKCDELLKHRNQKLQEIINQILCLAINKVSDAIDIYKQRNNLLSFDDLIVNLHKALVHTENPKLVAALRKKYKAVFVDEFQDTDRLQYEIFQKAFSSETILFYIGDPKQSIYAWRKADINTYLKARDNVNNTYDMNQNFRSSENFISAMNLFFKPTPDFNTFYFEKKDNEKDPVEYINVCSPTINSKGYLYNCGEKAVPITIFKERNNDSIDDALTAQLIELLVNDTYKIGTPGSLRRITPSDIGILVRTNKQAGKIKSALAKYGIPAVTIDDSKLLQSEEAVPFLYLLEAMTDVNTGTINKALLSAFTGFTIQDILSLNNEKKLELFTGYAATWQKDGIYTALMNFVADYNVRKVLLQRNSENGERVIANLFQLIELVHKVQTQKMFSPLELISWLKRGIEGMETDGDEYEQRVENDEASIKIVTIHKSKGLEYNIVFAPYLDFVSEQKNIPIASFRHPETGDYVAAEKVQLTAEQTRWMTEQAEQENRRLLYVAITRAVYKCFIFKNEHYKHSTLTSFVHELKLPDSSLINFAASLAIPEKYYYQNAPIWQPTFHAQTVHFTLVQKDWRRISYTMLAAKPELSIKTRLFNYAAKYDQFIFHDLTGGVKTGNLLHYIFENIHFTDNSKWMLLLEEAVKRFVPKHRDAWMPMLNEMLQQVLQARISVGGHQFQMTDIAFDKRIHELEFDFPMPVFNPAALNNLSDKQIQVYVNHYSELEGIMNGKIDLFFEIQGKYFILDWKSNFLGDSLK